MELVYDYLEYLQLQHLRLFPDLRAGFVNLKWVKSSSPSFLLQYLGLTAQWTIAILVSPVSVCTCMHLCVTASQLVSGRFLLNKIYQRHCKQCFTCDTTTTLRGRIEYPPLFEKSWKLHARLTQTSMSSIIFVSFERLACLTISLTCHIKEVLLFSLKEDTLLELFKFHNHISSYAVLII